MVYTLIKKIVWDDVKEKSNIKKHGLTFSEAITVFNDELAVILYDSEHSIDEARFNIIGFSDKLNLLFVVFVEKHDGLLRVISARKANKYEEKIYSEKNK